MRKIVFGVGVLLVLLAGGWGYQHWQAQQAAPPLPPAATAAKTAAPFELKDLNGQMQAVRYQETVTVLNFWATWCPPCREEIPELARFAQTLPAGVQFYAVNLQEAPDKVNSFLQKNQQRLPVLLDSEGSVAKQFQVNAIPTTVIIDRQGTVKFRKSGGVTNQELQAALKGI